MLKRNAKLLNRKIRQYLVPTVLMVFAMQFGSLLDGILVGNMVSGEALTASSLVMPVLFIIQLPGFALGTGGSIIVGKYLGRREMDKANKAFSVCITAGMLCSFVFLILSFIVPGPLARIYAPQNLVELGKDYLFIYMLTDPIITLALLMSSFMATDNNPRLASAMVITANIAKVLFELLFLGPMNMGMRGAALSTAAGYLIGFVTLIWYIRSKKRMLSYSLKVSGFASVFKECCVASESPAMNFLLNAMQMSVANILIARLVTAETEQLLFGIMSNFVFGFDLFAGGVIQLVPTLCPIFHGEEDYYSLRSTARKLCIMTVCITVFIMAVVMVFPSFYCRIFGFDYHGAEGFGIMRLFLISFLPYELNKFAQSYYPSIGENAPSLLNVLLREVILPLPLLFFLMHAAGLRGYALAMTLTETGTVIITILFVLISLKRKAHAEYGIWMIPQYTAQDSYDVSISGDIREAALLSEEIVDYARAHKMSERNSQIIGMAAEEIADNIITYGFRKDSGNAIDVNLKIVKDKMVLRLRDDGVIFDPTSAADDENTDPTSGLHLVRNLVERLLYLRIFNTNNTIMEIDLLRED